MMRRAALLALAERCEKYDANQVIDAEIHAALGKDDPHMAPRYTSSVDAAIEIAPHGFWEVSGPRKYLGIPTPVPNRWCAHLTPYDKSHLTFGAWAETEALARVATALRALAAREDGK